MYLYFKPNPTMKNINCAVCADYNMWPCVALL